jgi:lantibiotic modifying enzyme
VRTRTAWCYGNPGVSRSLRFASQVLRSESLHAEALMSIGSAFRRPWTEIESPTFCHGMAGLLQIALRWASEERTEEFCNSAEVYAARLIGMHEESRPFGYCSVELGHRRVDQPGLLDGAAGIALALLSFSEAQQPGWDRIFCIG